MRLFNTSKDDDNKDNSTYTLPQEVSFLADKKLDTPITGEKVIEEDALLVQIDSFREKAQTLQSLINERQNKVTELENSVKEKQDEIDQLQSNLQEKQEAYEAVVGDMKEQLDVFASRIDTSVYSAINDVKEPIMDKIHTENVRLYRNFYDFMKDDYNMEKIEALIKESGKGKGILTVTLIVSLINTGLLAYIFYSLFM